MAGKIKDPLGVGPGPRARVRRANVTRPLVQFVDPNWGPVTGGTNVTIRGKNFASGATVTFGGVDATSVVVVDAGTITCVTPASAESGLVNVIVTQGSQSSVFTNGFTYSATRVVTVTPASGILPGVVTVLLFGYNFVDGSTVTVDGVPATDVVVYDTQHLGFTTPSRDHIGFTDIVVTDPFGAVTTVRNGFQYITLARYADIRRDPGIQIQDQLNNAPNTASFTIDGEGAQPQPGESIVLVDSFDGNRKLFAGTVLQSQLDYDEQTDQLRWAATATDFTWLFNRRRPFGAYVLTPADDIVRDLVARYATGFTSAHVQTKLARITIQFDGSKDLATAMSDIASAIGGGHWYVDYDQDVHFFHKVPPEVLALTKPQTVIQGGPGDPMTVALSSTLTTFEYGIGFETYASTFIYDNDVESAMSLWSVPVPVGGNYKIAFTNIPIGPDVAGHSVVARRIYRIPFASPGGDQSQLLRQMFTDFQVNDNTTTSVECSLGGEDANVASVLTAGQLRAAGTPMTQTRPAAAAPVYSSASAPTASENLNGSPVWPQHEVTDVVPGSLSLPLSWTPTSFEFKVANLYQDLTISTLGPASNLLPTQGIYPVTLSGLPIGDSINGVPVVGRVVFSALGGAWDDPSKVWVWYYIPDNTSTSYDVVPDGPFPSSGSTPSNDSQDQTVAVWPNDDGPSLEDDDAPDPIDADNQTMTRDTPFSYQRDLSQVRNRVYVTGASTATTLDAAVGDDILVLADCSMFASGVAGQVYVNGQVLRYGGVTAAKGPGTLFLLDPLQYDTPNGSGVALFATIEDLDSQRALGLLELDKDGNPTDGVHEYVVQDSSLRSPAELIIRGHAEIELFANPIGTIRYSTRDPKTRSGATVHVDLTDPPCTGDFLIQQVTISQVRDESDDLAPLYTVSASSVKFNLEDLLLQILRAQGQNATSGASNITLAGLQEVVNQTFNSKSQGFDPTRRSLAWVQPSGADNSPVTYSGAGTATGSGVINRPTAGADDDPDALGLNGLRKADELFWGYMQCTATLNNASSVKLVGGVWVENNFDFTFVIRTPYQLLLEQELIWVGFSTTGAPPTTVTPAATINLIALRVNPGEGGWVGQLTTSQGVTSYHYYTDVFAPIVESTTYSIRIQSAFSPSNPTNATVTFAISTVTKGNIALQGTKIVKYNDTDDRAGTGRKTMPLLDQNHGSTAPMIPFTGVVNKLADTRLRWLKFGRIVGVWDAWENY